MAAKFLLLWPLTLAMIAIVPVAATENEKAFRKLDELAEKGDLDAKLIQGIMFFTGSGKIKKDEVKALEIFLDLANRNVPEAQYFVGVIYLNRKEYAAAYSYLEKAIENKNTEAEYLYGLILYKGIGTEKNEDEGIKYINSAAEKGNPSAKQFLAAH